MKKFLILIVTSIAMGMGLAYVTTASALSESCIGNPSQLECCVPNGKTYCSPDGSDQIINSCGSNIGGCNIHQGDYCQQQGDQAKCVNGGPVDPNGPYYVCQSPTVSKNLYGNTRACAADETCLTFQGCVKKEVAQCNWQCGGAAPGQPSFSRWNNCSESVEICPGGCENGQCKPGVCPQPQAGQQRCAWWGDVINGCGETVEKCAVGYTCLASATAQDCHCVPDPRPDLCLNIPDRQLSIPAGMVRDQAGNCYAPDPCAGTNFSLSTATPGADQDVSITCQMPDGGGDIYSTDRMWNHQSQQWETRVQKLGNGSTTFTPDTYNLKVNESTKISCVNPRKYDVSGNPRQCGEKTMSVIPPQCNRHYNPENPGTKSHRITLGQNITFKCDVAGYGAWIGLYKIWTPQSMWESRLNGTVDQYFNGIIGRMNGNEFVWDGEFFQADRSKYWGWKGNKGSFFAWGNYQSNGESVSGVLISSDVAKGEYTFQPQEEGTFFAVCFPRNRNGAAYPAGQDILQCGPSQYIVVDGTGTLADVQITKSVDKPTFSNKTGEIVTWTLNYKNNGPQDAANVIITDTLPEGLTYFGDFVTAGTPFASIKLLPGNKIEWKLKDSLAANQSGVIILKTKYTGGLKDNTKLMNVVMISTTTPGDDIKNNGYSALTRPVSLSCVPPVLGSTPKYKCSNYACIQDDSDGTFLSADCDNACNTNGVTIYDIATSSWWTRTRSQIGTSLLNSYPTSNKEKCSNGQCYKNTPAGKATVWVASWEEINGDSAKNSCEPYISDFWFALASCDTNTLVSSTKLTLRSDYLGTQVQHPWSLAVDGGVAPGRYKIFYVPGFAYGNYTINTLGWNSNKVNIGGNDGYLSPCFEVKAGETKHIQAGFKAPVSIDSKSHPRWSFDPANGQSHIYENSKCDVKPLCPTAVLGDYIRYDLNKNGLQDPGENGVAGVTLDLYECDASVRGLTLWKGGAGDPNMPTGYVGKYISSLVTTSTGYYLFNVDPNKLYYVKAKSLPAGFGFTTQYKDGYATHPLINSNFNPLTLRSTCESPELANDGGIVPTDPVSCNGLTYSVVPTNTGSRIDYICSHSGATDAMFALYSGSSQITGAKGFTGSVFVAPGTYTGVCVLNGDISYKVIAYAPLSSVSCAYKKHNSDGTTCAVKASLDPFSGSLLNLKNLILMPSPVLYCTTTQISDTNYSCVDSPAGSKILTQDPSACIISGIVVKKLANLGDYVWVDTNKDGTQDASENGLSNVVVNLYNCADNTLITGSKTDSAGKYMFYGLTKGSYQVRFVKPTGYEWSPSKAGANTGVDSNAPDSECVFLDPENGIDQNLTLDAGVYTTVGTVDCDPTKICCQKPCNGGGGWCGDGIRAGLVKLSDGSIVGEQCDDGNNANGDGCSKYCQNETIIPHSGTGKQIVDVNPLSCGMIDPPDVMIGEYVPFWWKYDNPSDIKQVSSCGGLNQSNTDPDNTYVLNTTDSTDGQLCAFYLKNGAGEKSKLFYKYCNVKQQFNSANLTDTYLDGASNIVRGSYGSSLGASYIAPGHWIRDNTTEFTKFGEYQIVWDKTTYRTCNRVETKNASGVVISVNYVKSSNRWIADNADCTMNLTVTKPYMTQKNGLSASSEDLQVMNNIVNFSDGTSAIGNSPTTVSNVSFSGSSNLTYLVKQFVQKYSKLASKNDTVAGISAKKVPNSNIYVIGGGEKLVANANLGPITIIVPEGNLTIVGSIKGNVMIIVPNGYINIKPNGATDTQITPSNQILQGVYIAKQLTSDDLHNSDIDKSWRFGGQLKIDGLLVNTENGQNAITSLKNVRRSSLTDYTTNPVTSWFQVLPTKRTSIVQNGASLQITSSPSLWTNLPPGANELMKELQAFK